MKPHHAPLRLLYVGTALLILLLLATNAAVIWHLRKSELLDQEALLKNRSLILAEQGDRSFQSVDLVIRSVADGIAAEGVTDAASFERIMAGQKVNLLLQAKISGTPQLDAVLVLNSEGRLINFSRTGSLPDTDDSNRPYFRALKGDPYLQTYVTEPLQDRGTGAWTVFLARRVNGPFGEFFGVILGAIRMQYFENFYQAISVGGSTALLRLDGVTLVRFPQTETIGKAFSNAERLLHGAPSAVLHHVNPIDGQKSIVAVQLLTNYPVLAITTVTEENALADWRSFARLMALGALGCAISIAIAGYASGRQWKQKFRLADSQAELGRQEERAVAMRAAAEVAEATALRVAHAAEHDFLTGLPNRALLNDRVGQAIALAQRHEKHAALLFLDLDGFKHINDSLGHAIGDKLLQSIARRLTSCVRASDTVSRQGGDEFIVLLSELEDAQDAAVAAERIVRAVAAPTTIERQELHIEAAIAARKMLHAVAEPHSVAHHDLHVTASIGVSIYPDDGQDAETLIQHADTAMYQAKENGRQSFQFFEPDMNARAVERQFIEEGLRRALERREFALHYQPIIDLTTGTIIGAEALIRWMHPTRGLVPPLQFIPVAEDCGLMLPIGKWVLREACRQTQTWIKAGFPVETIAVNVSALEFRAEHFLEGVFAILSETDLDPRFLNVELTESVLMKRPDAAASILRNLRKKGVRVAIDDFGTGYSSLGYLQKFPLDALKIDQSFVSQIGAAGANTSIVTAVIGMAQSLQLRIIAEGVETREQLEFLRALHCEEAQGYYFSRPVPPEQFEQLLKNGIPEAALTPSRDAASKPRAPAVSGV